MLRLVRIALVLVLALLLAGCGSGSHGTSKSAYEHRMAALVPTLQGQVLKLRFALEQVRTPSAGRARLQRIEGKLRAAIAGLEAIDPPKEVAADQASLVAGYRALLVDFTALNPLAQKQSTDALRVQAGKLHSAPALSAIGHALQAIVAKGYDLGFPQGS